MGDIAAFFLLLSFGFLNVFFDSLRGKKKKLIFFFFLIPVDETFHSDNSELRELPAIELSTLPLILKVLKDD